MQDKKEYPYLSEDKIRDKISISYLLSLIRGRAGATARATHAYLPAGRRAGEYAK